jgi:hypothetical protein
VHGCGESMAIPCLLQSTQVMKQKVGHI